MRPASVNTEKRRLRGMMRDQRRQVSPEQRRLAGEAVMRHVLASGELRPGRRIAMYVALPDELPTEGLLRALLRRDFAVLLPRARADRGLDFVRVVDPSRLAEGPFGALEPPPAEPGGPLGADDLVLLPGVAFDEAGGRLGRGGGWYDRSLPDDPSGLFGLAYRFQLVDTVPVTPLDRRVGGVFTECGLHRCVPRSQDARSDSS